ncbi:hypothetical protein HYU21_04380 [Candidatus Woesearchaeota archaeon]|nr:hypothetical protein [Candidatus Woesearchaeota archaeon]
MIGGIKAKCRVCGSFASSDQFKLHYQYRMMVCPSCYSGKTASDKEKKKVEENKKPAGWDEVDVYLSKVSHQKQQEKGNFRNLMGSSLLECTCTGCKYVFRYDPVRQTPHTCPYCDMEVPKGRR